MEPQLIIHVQILHSFAPPLELHVLQDIIAQPLMLLQRCVPQDIIVQQAALLHHFAQLVVLVQQVLLVQQAFIVHILEHQQTFVLQVTIVLLEAHHQLFVLVDIIVHKDLSHTQVIAVHMDIIVLLATQPIILVRVIPLVVQVSVVQQDIIVQHQVELQLLIVLLETFALSIAPLILVVPIFHAQRGRHVHQVIIAILQLLRLYVLQDIIVQMEQQHIILVLIHLYVQQLVLFVQQVITVQHLLHPQPNVLQVFIAL